MNNLATSAKRLADLVERQAASGLITNDLIRAAGEVQFAVNSEAAKAEFKNVTPAPQTHVDVEDVREQKLATIVAPDNGTPDEVLSYVLECAKAWVPEARIIGNARAGDIARAIEALPSPQMHVKWPEFGSFGSATAMMDVIDERLRQQSVEGWSLEHDDAHSSGEMAAAAATYAYSTTLSDRHRQYVSGIYSIDNSVTLRELWPASWDKIWWKPTDRRRDLVKAAALLIAEIERLDRAAATEGKADG